MALVIFFNHNYQDNISVLEQIYGHRFKNIWFVIPFYSGSKNNVIPVYDDSFYFQGFIATASEKLKSYNFKHILFIADDLLLNPKINEDNYQNYFKLEENSGFIPNYFSLTDSKETRPSRPFAPFWSSLLPAINFKLRHRGFEGNRYLPKYEIALNALKQHKIFFNPRVPKQMLFPKKWIYNCTKMEEFKKLILSLSITFSNLKYLFKSTKLIYPLVGGYSDILIIPRKSIESFIQYAHAFSALNLFVEIAAPTALLLSSEKVVTEESLDFKAITFWNGHDNAYEEQYQNSLEKLLNSFPADVLYVHPIKLSRWK